MTYLLLVYMQKTTSSVIPSVRYDLLATGINRGPKLKTKHQ